MLSIKIKEILKESKLSKKEFAEKIDVNPSQITRYLQEEQNISSKTIIKICELFNVSADWLLGLTEKII